MIYLAAILSGFGGLLLEMCLLRRHGLLLGNTSAAASLVLACFLLGLGLGGYGVRRLPLQRIGPLGMAALLYALVALLAVLGDLFLASLAAKSWGLGFLLCLLVPGLPALLMGLAFPLLFSGWQSQQHPSRSAALMACNLAGSVVAAWVGGNLLIPILGLAQSSLLVSLAYALAALGLAWQGRRQHWRPPAIAPLPALGRLEALALVSGMLVLGLEIYLLRRLPFFLDGFQPTLSGVIAVCLLGLALGSAFGTALLHRWAGSRAAVLSLWLAVIAMALGLHEWGAGVLGQISLEALGLDHDLGLHLRVALAAFAAAALPCFFLGATVPLCLLEFKHRETRAALAGRLFCSQGLGALLGALLLSQVMPWLWPQAYFVASLPVLGLLALALTWRPPHRWPLIVAVLVLCLASLGVSGAGGLWQPAAPVMGSRYDKPERYRHLDHATDSVLTASVAYDRSLHSMILFTDEFRAAYTGPDTGYMRVLGHLPFLLQPNLQRVAVVALGTGTTANAVACWPQAKEIHVVEISAAVRDALPWFAGDGPVPTGEQPQFMQDLRTSMHITDGRRFVARQQPASLDLITMEPLLPYAPGTVPLYSREFYDSCKRALKPQGLMLQWLPTHALPAKFFDSLCLTFADSFAYHSLWLVDQSTLLVGSSQPHLPSAMVLQERLQQMPKAARLQLHQAGLGTWEDLCLAHVTANCTAAWPAAAQVPRLLDDRPFLEHIGYWSRSQRLAFLPENLARLQQWSAASNWPQDSSWPARRQLRLQGLQDLAANGNPALALRSLNRLRQSLPHSLLLHGEEGRALVGLKTQQIYQALAVQSKAVQSKAAQKKADPGQLLQREPAQPLLLAALALRSQGRQRQAILDRLSGLDPYFLPSLPFPQLRQLQLGDGGKALKKAELEDLQTLPEGKALAAAAAAPGVRGYVLCCRFPQQVGHALCQLLAQRPLQQSEQDALRLVLDPFLIELMVEKLLQRQASLTEEFLPLWRRDLAAPRALVALLDQGPAQRQALAQALTGRQGAGALNLLASLLLDSELAVRRAAGVTLFQTVGERIPYDAQGSQSQQRAAAEQLRNLHNR